MYTVHRLNGKVTGVLRTADGAFIPKDTGNPDWQTFLLWNAQQVPPLDLSDLGPDLPPDYRALAKTVLDKANEQVSILFRAFLVELLGHMNTQLAQKHNDLLTWLGGQTTLINRNQLPGMAASQPTLTQARNAIKADIDAGSADV